MKPVITAALLAAVATPALAYDLCDDLWFSRNQLYDRAGYCFSTALGQAVFDNEDCIGKEVTLEPGADALIAHIKWMEAEFDCDVDTTASTLDIPNLALRFRLEQVVAKSEFASGCLDWQGEPLPLRAGPRPEAEVISVVMPGQDIVWEYDTTGPPADWGFVTIYFEDQQIGLGWLVQELDHELCGRTAG